MNFEEIFWHDGIFSGLSIRENGETLIDCEVFPSLQSKQRERIRIILTGVSELSCTLDLASLLDNRNAGNIATGRVYVKNKKTFIMRLILSDGYLDIKASQLIIHRT